MDSLVGFRFKPTDEEIIHLLKKKRLEPDFVVHTVKEIDIYKYEPWELSGLSAIQCKEEVWYFYCEPYYKYAKSKRAHRRTNTGYWKVTGQGSKMKAKNSSEAIGNKRILTFCCPGVSSTSKKANTEWVMHEISVEDDPLYKKDFVVCRVERKRDIKLGVSTSNEDESITRNHVAENTSLEPTQSPNHQLVSNRNHVAENTSPHSTPLPNQQSVPCSTNMVVPTFESEPQLLAKFNPPGGYDGPNNASSAPQSLIYWKSSYPNCFNYGFDLLISDGDMINSMAFLNEPSPEERGQTSTPDFNSSKSDEFSREATGQTFSPEFNSSKSDGAVYGESSSDRDTESFTAWVKDLFEN